MQYVAEVEKPLELAFLDQYGPIQKHLWFGDGYILVRRAMGMGLGLGLGTRLGTGWEQRWEWGLSPQDIRFAARRPC